MLKYIFVVGGVMSGVGKGVAAASIGKILKAQGFNVTAVKIDPYVNVDAGTMNPTEHGEVFVLDDGTECDQDMGNYERFLDSNLSAVNYMTTGSIYQSVIQKERNLEFNGQCVQVVPHICLEVLSKIDKAAMQNNAEIIIVEIGGTVGEYENILFLEAVRILKTKKPRDVFLALVSYLPYQGKDGELKTKPTQHAVRNLNSVGLQPDMILARAPVPLDKIRKRKIAFHCSIFEENVISAPDVANIYEIPINFERDNLSNVLLRRLNLKPRKRDFKEWRRFVNKIHSSKAPVKIAIVGKYFDTGNFVLTDSYISVIEAIKHAAYFFKRKPEIVWLSAEDFEYEGKSVKEVREHLKRLRLYDGIIVPGGFGSRGVEGKINVIGYVRTKKIPFLGLCYGLQLALVEYSRSVLGYKDAHSTEVNAQTLHPVIDIIPEQKKNLAESKYGGTMRLGSYPAVLKKGTIAYSAYKESVIYERHRHRFEVNPQYIEELQQKGIIFSGISPDMRLVEIIELSSKVHPFFLGTQFHPEFKSRPLSPHPLFREFIKAAINFNKKKR
jgi:CTP synthase